ncbi:MAG: hypothetical protein ACHQ1H_13205 [Nitrososphaerales archaeon]
MQTDSDGTTILVSMREKRRLDRRKLHAREPYQEVLKRVLDEVDSYERRDQRVRGSETQGREIEETLDKIVEGRLANWSPSNRSHEKMLFDEVAKK